MESLTAWSTFATGVLTGGLLVAAVIAGSAALGTLKASRLANEQAKYDSIEQTRPYVFVEALPSLAGTSSYDVRIANSGKSAARDLTFDLTAWPEPLDDVASSVRDLFTTPRTLPPGCSIRAMWRLEGKFSDGTTVAGMNRTATVTASYTSDDPSRPAYKDSFDLMIDRSGLWPVPESGPEPNGHLKEETLQFYKLGQALVRRVGEFTR